jgi:hypothetical protein
MLKRLEVLGVLTLPSGEQVRYESVWREKPMRSRLRRLERAAHGGLEYIELEDGTRYWYDRLETAKELFLHSIDCLHFEYEEWPEPPEVYRGYARLKTRAPCWRGSSHRTNRSGL